MAQVKTVSIEAKNSEGLKTEAVIRGHHVAIDQPPAVGGTDSGINPLENLFMSIAGCFAYIARLVAKQKGITMRSLDMKIEGALDVSVLLGKSDGRAGFPEIKVTAELDADLTPEQKREFLEEVDRRCPVSDCLMQATPVRVELAG